MTTETDRDNLRIVAGDARRGSSKHATGIGLAALALWGCTDPGASPCDGIECSGRGFCIVDQGQAYCGCLHGYHPERLTCVTNASVDPCEGVSCSDHGTCRVVSAAPTCDCDPGYRHLVSDSCGEVACELLCVAGAASDGGPDTEAEAEAGAEADVEAEAEADVPPPCGNGLVEAGEECDGAAPRSCTTTCGSTGTQACVDCHWESACTPPAEFCNGLDDDCVSGADNGFACRQGATRDCVSAWTGCDGTQTCGPTCTWLPCAGPDACRDIISDWICDGSTGDTGGGGCDPDCRTCSCSDGSWDSCGICHPCPG